MDELEAIRAAYDRTFHFPDSTWTDFADRLIQKKFKKSDYLIREGQVEHSIYFLYRGSTRNYFIMDGNEYTVDFHFQNDFVCAYYSFVTREPGDIFIQALEDLQTLVISYHQLQDFYSKFPLGEKMGRLIAEQQYVRRLQKEMELISLSAEERYSKLLKQRPEVINSLSIKHLSSYLGIKPESLSRIRKGHSRN